MIECLRHLAHPTGRLKAALFLLESSRLTLKFGPSLPSRQEMLSVVLHKGRPVLCRAAWHANENPAPEVT